MNTTVYDFRLVGAGSEGMIEHQADYRLMKRKEDTEE